jgi:hypothetical protein
VTRWQVAGAALLALLPLHVALRPEHVWALFAACDLACIATALGLLFRSHRLVGTAFLFQVAVGFPSLIVGLCTHTYPWNWSGVTIHIVPLVLGGIRVASEGLPRRAALDAWIAYAIAVVVTAAVSPAKLNINFASVVWPPVAKTFSLHQFQALMIVVVGAVLAVGQLVARLVSSRPARASTPRRGTA